MKGKCTLWSASRQDTQSYDCFVSRVRVHCFLEDSTGYLCYSCLSIAYYGREPYWRSPEDRLSQIRSTAVDRSLPLELTMTT